MTLHQALSGTRRRLRLARMLRFLGYGLLAGSLMGFLFLLLTLFALDLENRWPALLCPAALGALMALISLPLPIPDRLAARAADAAGLEERCQTALETDRETPMGRLLHEDTLQKLSLFRPADIPLRAPRRLFLVSACLALACVLVLILPNPGLQRARDRQAWQMRTSELSQEAAEAANALDDTKAEDREIRRILETLSRSLSDSRSMEDVYLSLDQAEKMLGRTGMQGMSAAASGDASQSQALSSAGISGTASEEGASGEAGESTSVSSETAQAAENASNSPSSASMQAAQALLAALRAGMSASSAAGQTQGTSSGESSTGSASAPGSGASQGQQPGGGGASTGEGSRSDAVGQGSASGRQTVQGHYHEAEFESVYDPEFSGRDTYDTSLSGERRNDEGMQIETGPSQGMADGKVPLGQVRNAYAETAVDAVRNMDLTSSQKDLVVDYFQALSDRQ